MSSITFPTPDAVALAKDAVATFKRRAGGYPDVPRERCEELVRELQSGKVGKLDLTEAQQRSHRNTLTEQNERIALVAAAERAAELRDFFKADKSFAGYIVLDFNDWAFLAGAETIKIQ